MEHQNSESRENVMAFIVMYERNDGSLAAESCQDLDAAVMAAERLRNSDSIEHPRIFETTEVEYEFKPYFRVQVAGAATDEDSTDGTTATAAGAETAESAEAADIDWPSFEPPADGEDEAAEDEVSEAEAGAYGIGVGELDSPNVEGAELDEADSAAIEDAADVDVDGEVDETTTAEAGDSDVSDLDVLNVDEDDVDSDIDLDAAETEVTEGDHKVGLFDKFVKTLEGDSDGAADQVDDMTGSETNRRGLFGR